jgi:hypothetical protein
MEKVIREELSKLRDEMNRAEQDGNSSLSLLVGWEEALKWVLRQMKKEEVDA